MIEQLKKENPYFSKLWFLVRILKNHFFHFFFLLFNILALPLAEIIWDKDGEIITVDSAFRIDYYSDGRATLYIPETFLDDQGYYTCTARNSLGTCRTTARLIIKCKLNIKRYFSSKSK
jgi:hypothetical protein